MVPPLPRPRASWVPGAVVLGSTTLAGLAIGWALGARQWWIYVGLVLAAVMAVGLAERLWASRQAPRPPRGRGRLKVIPGGKAGFDLEKDDPDQKQRWLM